ncbi:MAG: tetratricopeptide repeat protein, partial [Planctomycetales bacterium]|nr:tetratricopeptide repeat protein [Planctomycetales bacterium]
RNAQDIFVPLYNHQIPPGAGQVAHFGFRVPPDAAGPLTVEVKLQYRKFDQAYMDYVAHSARDGDRPLRGKEPGQIYRNELPIVTIASDRIVLPLAGRDDPIDNAESKIPPWQRWNDYGIGLLLGDRGSGRGELQQAAEAFQEVEKLNRYDGPLNLARVLYADGSLDDAVAALARVAKFNDPPAPPWTVAWLSGQVNREQGHLEQAEQQLRQVLSPPTAAMVERGFDFRLDYEVINLLGMTLFDRAKGKFAPEDAAEREKLLRDAAEQFQKTLTLDAENVAAHHNLALIYEQLNDPALAEKHRQLHMRYKPDDNAQDRAIAAARQKYPAANHAAEVIVIYDLQRSGAFELPAAAASPPAAVAP